MKTKEEEEIKRLIENFGITVFGAVLEAEAKEHDTKSIAWNIVGGIGKDMKENPDQYHSIIENMLEAWNRANK
jgi:hypothetical protein